MKKSKSPRRATYLAAAVPHESKGMIEKKSVDVNITSGNMSFNTTGAAVLLNGMLQGSNAYQRSGRKIILKALHLKGAIFYKQAGAAPGNDYFRLMVVYDKQSDGSGIAFATLLQNVDNSGATSSTALSGMNLDNGDRFVMLRDYRFKTDAISAPQVAGDAQQDTAVSCPWIINDYINLQDSPTIYGATANAGTIADIQTGSIWLMALGSQSAANFQYEFVGSSRLRFVDI